MRDPRPAVAEARTGDDKGAASFELRVLRDAAGGSTSILPMVRRFVRELCMRVIFDPDVTTRVVVATHELLDNAVRHSERDAGLIRLTVERASGDAEVVIETTNFVDERRARDLEAIVTTLADECDGVHYRGALRGIAFPADDVAARSGLGLGRVRAEAAFEVGCRFENGIAYVRARARFPMLTEAVKVR